MKRCSKNGDSLLNPDHSWVQSSRNHSLGFLHLLVVRSADHQRLNNTTEGISVIDQMGMAGYWKSFRNGKNQRDLKFPKVKILI
jgi:hypothetical protein